MRVIEGLFVIGLILLVAFAVWMVFFMLTGQACDAQFPDIEHRYSIGSGCLVHTTEGWVPADNYRVIE